MNEVTRILRAIEDGDRNAADQLLPLVYDELRKLAAQRLAQERPGQTLQATALVHDAYLRLLGGGDVEWNNRGHFFAAAAEAMRRILVENARRKGRIKHGGDFKRIELSDIALESDSAADELLAVNDALARLEMVDPAVASLVKLRYFVGLSMPDVAETLGMSLRTAERSWTFARTWLKRELSRGMADGS
ncbi:MAG TPA: ECF-type sigma factor [Pirellulales bacterium]|nr:ECF-type sigma factor [Pirellulales bacterium]